MGSPENISLNELAELVRFQNFKQGKHLIVDCRNFIDYNECHVQHAKNAFYSKIMRRRLLNGKTTDEFLLSQLMWEVDETSTEGASSSKNDWTLILYGLQKTDHVNGNDRFELCDFDDAADFARVLFQRIRCGGLFGKVLLLKGTFTEFRHQYPDLCDNSERLPRSKTFTSENPLFDGNEETSIRETSTKSHTFVYKSPLRTSPSEHSVMSSSTSSTRRLTRLCLPTSFSTPCIPSSSSDSEPNGPTEILDFLFLGSQEDALDPSVILNLPISKVINISENCPRSDLIPNDERHFLRIPVNDTYDAKLSPFFEKAYEFIENARRSNQKVLVHCLAGISRSASLAIAYIMRSKKLSAEDAYKFVQARRPSISPNFNFMGQLTVYERNLRRAKLLPPKEVETPTQAPCSSSVSFSCASVLKQPLTRAEPLENLAFDEQTAEKQSRREASSTNENGKRTINIPLAMPERPKQLLFAVNKPTGLREETSKRDVKRSSASSAVPALPSPSTEFSKLDISLENPLFRIEDSVSDWRKGKFEKSETIKDGFRETHKTFVETAESTEIDYEQDQSVRRTFLAKSMIRTRQTEGRYNLRRADRYNFQLPSGENPEPVTVLAKDYPMPVAKRHPKTKLGRLRKSVDSARAGFDVIDEEEDADEVFSLRNSPFSCSATTSSSTVHSSISTDSQASDSSLALPRTPESGYLDDFVPSQGVKEVVEGPQLPAEPGEKTDVNSATTDSFRDPERDSISSTSSLEIAVQ